MDELYDKVVERMKGSFHPDKTEERLIECITNDNRLVISIGVGTLAFCANEHPLLYDGENDKNVIKVVDVNIFAKEVLKELQREREDGSTLVTDMLDKAVYNAIEWGCEGVEEL